MRILLLIIALVLTNCGGENKPTAAPVATEVVDAEQGAANAAADNSDATGTATVHPDSSPPADEGQPPPVEMASDPNALPTPAGPDGPVEGTSSTSSASPTTPLSPVVRPRTAFPP